MRMVGMPDAFAAVGPTPKVRAKYGMSAEAIVEACHALLTFPFDLITPILRPVNSR